MKLARNVFFGLVMAGAVVFFANAAFAQTEPAAGKDSSAWQAKHEAKMKLLQDSAAALQQTNPDLASQLSAIVSKEKSTKDKYDARIKLFKDAAAALAQSHPDLAKSLEEMTVVKHKTEMQKAAEEKNEKEEVGEKVEPKPEQGEAK